jgi:MraZ protein
MPDGIANAAVTFSSVFEHGVDEKRRVQIPAKWRPGDPETELTVMLWGKNEEICLRVLPPAQFQKLRDKIEAMPGSKEKVSRLRNLGANSEQITVDKGGRIILPERMAKAAGIGEKATLVGLFEKFEIWNSKRYEAVAAADAVIAAGDLESLE